MIIFAGLYLAYTNTNYSSFENLKNKDNFVIKFQNLPEMILPSKEVTTGYQYELIKFYLNNIGNKNIIMKNTLFDVEVYYSTEICSYCIVVNNEDLLIVTLDISNENPDVETIKSFSDIQFKQDIYKDYDINFIDVSIDELINDVHNNLITNIIITRSTYLFYKKYFPNLKIKSKIGKINLLWSFPNDDNSIRENVNLFSLCIVQTI